MDGKSFVLRSDQDIGFYGLQRCLLGSISMMTYNIFYLFRTWWKFMEASIYGIKPSEMLRWYHERYRDSSRWLGIYQSIVPECSSSFFLNSLGSTYYHVLMFLVFDFVLYPFNKCKYILVRLLCCTVCGIFILCVNMCCFDYYFTLYRELMLCVMILSCRFVFCRNIVISTPSEVWSMIHMKS